MLIENRGDHYELDIHIIYKLYSRKSIIRYLVGLLGGKRGGKGKDKDTDEDEGAGRAGVATEVRLSGEHLRELREGGGGLNSDVGRRHLSL